MFPAIETQRLVLRRLEQADAAPLHAYRSHPDVSRYQSWEPQSLKEVARFIEQQQAVVPNTPGTWMQLGLTLKSEQLLIGDCGIHFVDRAQVEFGVSLDPKHQGRGYAAEALKGVLGYLFIDLNKHRVFGSADPDNRASLALMERVGMRKEAHFKQSYWFKDRWADDVIYAMLASEFKDKTI